LDRTAPRSATIRSAGQTTNFVGRPVTNADCRVSQDWGGGEAFSASRRTGPSKIQSIRSQTDRRHSPTMHQYWRLARWLLSCGSGRMDHSELRVRIRLLMASGELPPGPPLADRILPGQVAPLTRIIIGEIWRGSCLICDESGPEVSYAYADRRVIRLHTACDALWQQGVT
jgi:hypothetical protein